MDEIQRESIEIANQGTEWGVKKGKRFWIFERRYGLFDSIWRNLSRSQIKNLSPYNLTRLAP
jgi:hypothetical protein